MVKNLRDQSVILSDKDNVATAVVDLAAGDYLYDRSEGRFSISVPESIRAGFKLALSDIGKGDPIYKYGYVIGLAVVDINRGQCVHVHNLVSAV
jgi:hypothetical protein